MTLTMEALESTFAVWRRGLRVRVRVRLLRSAKRGMVGGTDTPLTPVFVFKSYDEFY
jgi:hypothetical protein